MKLYNFLKSKIHNATVTESNINYDGSVTIDSKLLVSSGMYPFEQVDVLNITNGQRATTYIIEGEEDSGEICLNGALARLGEVGDKVIIVSYQQVPAGEKYLVNGIKITDDKNLKFEHLWRKDDLE